ncbi:MAG TPA: enoyl-CoA hydratase/isomerase family protein [Thermohalobaculum sp.]|nr:enoyl-CoA hydratase/isomerase family protein [Thermohalobaculum sp.]
MDDELLHEVADGIGWVTFNRPDSRNSLTFAMYEGLAEICEQAEPGGPVRVIVLRGAGGRAFAAGTDMSQFRGFQTSEDAWGYELKMERVFERIERCKVPTIAAITGACTGGGAAIAACCDLRISDRRLRYGFPIARTLGNCLSVASLSRLVAILGDARVREILVPARLIEAEEAKAVGLVSEVVEDAGAVMDRAQELARLLATHAPLTLRATKEALRRLRAEGEEAEDRDLIELTYMSEDFREGMEAFLAKRTPRWKGR